MGQDSSMRWAHSGYVCSPPDVMKAQLLQNLWCIPLGFARLQNLFAQKAVRSTQLNVDCWTEDTLINHLVDIQKDIEPVIRGARPLIQKIMLHHGAHPFRPTSNTLLDFNTMAMAIGMSSQNGAATSCKQSLHDRLRVYFQALSRPRTLSPTGSKEGSKVLPGHIPPHDLRLLLRLFVSLSIKQCGLHLSNHEESREEVVDALHNGFFSDGTPVETGISWSSFTKTISNSMPNLLYPYQRFIEDAFKASSGHGSSDSTPNPEDQVALARARSSRIITGARFIQLRYTFHLPIPFLLEEKVFDAQSLTNSKSSAFKDAISPRERLLLVKAKHATGTTDQPILFGAWVSDQDGPNHDTSSMFEPEAGVYRSTLFQLSPRHQVLTTVAVKDTDACDVTHDEHATTLRLKHASLCLSHDMKRLTVQNGAESLEFNIEHVEVWA